MPWLLLLTFVNPLALLAQVNQPTRIAINFAADEPVGVGSAVTGPAGALMTATWNNVEGATGTATSLLGDAHGTAVPTAASVTWSSPNTWRTGAGQNTAPEGNDRNLMTGYIDTSNTQGVVVDVEGVPFPSYDVYIHILGDNITAGRGGDYTIGDQTVRHLMTAPFDGNHVEGPGGSYIVIRGVSGSAFTLETTPLFPEGGTIRAPVAAMEIVAAADDQLKLFVTGKGDRTLTFSWSGGTGPFLVQVSDLTGPWFNVVTTSNRSTTQPMSHPVRFFRVQDQTTRTITQFFAWLDGAQENPPVTTPGSGVGGISLEGNSLSYLVSYSGLTANATMAHFHGPADVGANAGVMLGLTPISPQSTSGLYGAVGVPVNAAFIEALNAGLTYLNIHTSMNPEGEIRGQVLPASELIGAREANR